VQLNAVSEVDAVFSHGWPVWMFETDVPLMLLQRRDHGTACLPNADLAALTGYFVYTPWMGQDRPTQLGPSERASLNHVVVFCKTSTYQMMDRV
jgi:hypothetical protein